MQSKAATVEQYLAELPADRRAAISAVRDTIRQSLDPAYQETMQYGMIGYCVPHSLFPAGYHCNPSHPLPFAGLASQKNSMSIYLMCIYDGGDADSPGAKHTRWFREAWAKTGKKLDMGKSCIRFKKVEDLALDVIGEAIRRVPAKKWIEIYQASLEGRRPTTKKAPKPAARARAASRKAKAKKPAGTKRA